MRNLNKCSKCHNKVFQVKSRFVDGKIKWFCEDCYEKKKNRKV